MNHSLRSRLLLGIGATIATSFVVTAVTVFVLIRASMLKEFDALLGSKARALAILIEQRGNIFEIEFADHPMQEFARKIRPEYYQVWDDDGKVIARSRRLAQDDLIHASGSLAAPGYQITILPDGRSGRQAAVQFLPAVEGETLEHAPENEGKDIDHDDFDKFDFSQRRRVTLVVARETSEIDQALASLGWILFGVSSAVIATTLAVLAWIVKCGLHPLHALANIFSNMVEYVEPRGSMEAGWAMEQDGLRLTFVNSGCTLSRAQSARVFDRFWRADAARSATGSHAGLGLALCQRIVHLLGGSIVAEVRNSNFIWDWRCTIINLLMEYFRQASSRPRGWLPGIAMRRRLKWKTIQASARNTNLGPSFVCHSWSKYLSLQSIISISPGAALPTGRSRQPNCQYSNAPPRCVTSAPTPIMYAALPRPIMGRSIKSRAVSSRTSLECLIPEWVRARERLPSIPAIRQSGSATDSHERSWSQNARADPIPTFWDH